MRNIANVRSTGGNTSAGSDANFQGYLKAAPSSGRDTYGVQVQNIVPENNFEKIKSSEKIKWVYLKPNTMNVKQIGFKGYDDPPEIMDFIKENIDYDKLFTRALEKKIRMFYEALKWDMPVDKINTLERFF